MSSLPFKHDRIAKHRFVFVVILPGIALIVLACCSVVLLQEVSFVSLAKGNRGVPSDRFLNFGSVRRCALLAMIITSEADYQNGTMNAWFDTLPKAQTDRVCCVSVRRSTTASFDFEQSSTSCDTLFVPMIREDQYLTISEKVLLGFSQVMSQYDFKWLLKTDADSFVCFSRVLNLLQNFDPDGVTYLGYAESRNILIEDPAHKWYDPSMTDLVHNSRQPIVSGTGLYHPYMQGAGYVLSRGAMETIRAALPSLRYSPMEDAMVGSWLLALNAHWGVLNLDLRAAIEGCLVPEGLYISHYRKGSKALGNCLEANPKCADLSEVQAGNAKDISFLITTHMELRGNQALDLYDSIRAIFPTNEIVFGDVSQADAFLNRFAARKDDQHLHVHSFPRAPVSKVKNSLVSLAKGDYVCMLQDVQRLSWETMMGTMLHPVQAGEVDVTAGYLVFNPHMMNSSLGLIQYGYKFRYASQWLTKKAIEPEMNTSQDSSDVHGTTGFILARRSFLLLNGWRDIGPFSEDDFHFRLFRRNARIRLVNSGVRHGYHYPLPNNTETLEDIQNYAPKICDVIAQAPERPTKMQGANVTLDCDRNIFKRAYTNPNLTSLNTFFTWSRGKSR